MTTPHDGASFFDAEMSRFLAQFEADVKPLEELQARVQAVRGRGEAADGLVRAEVSASGALGDLRIDPRALRLGADALAEAVLAAASDATADLTRQMAGMMTDGLTPFADEAGRLNED